MILYYYFNKIAPIIKKCIRGKPSSWLTNHIRDKKGNNHDMSVCPMLAYKSKPYKTKEKVNSLLHKSKQAHYKDLLNETSNNLNSFWKTIKKLYRNGLIIFLLCSRLILCKPLNRH